MTATTASKRAVGQALLGYYERDLFLTTYTGGPYEKDDPDGLRNDVHHYAHTWFKQDEHTNVEEAVAHLPFRLFGFEYDIATWHAKTKPVEAMAKAHVLRIIKGWKHETALHTYLKKNPFLCSELGFDSVPGQKALWKAWKKRFSDRHKDALRDVAEELVQLARYHGVPAPDRVFRPDETDTEQKTEAQVTVEKTRKVWRKAKPFVTEAFYLLRGENAQIPESAFWEQHAFLGSRDDMFAESGHTSFLAETTRDRAPTASNHRWQIRKHNEQTVREMLRNATSELVERARRDSELVGGLTVAIDITKGHEYTGKHQDKHGDWIMGYKQKDSENITHHFQWATIQIVGLDVPLVLDAIPLKKGESPRHEIVDELLTNALDIVDDIELVMMDREFAHEAIKNVCERHGVYYLNPGKKNSSERATCTALRKAGKKTKVEEQEMWNGESRKVIYVPAHRAELWGDEDDEEEEDEGPTMRQELLDEFGDILPEGDEDEERRPFDNLLNDLEEQEEQQETRGSDEDAQQYALFETNHPAVSRDDSLTQLEEFIDRYSHRWGIENGFRKIKKFMVRTSSTCHKYRFFNFAFACVLYNVWRLVDLLVKLEFEEEPDYAPRVDAGTFLTIAKDYLGLGPPD